MDENKPDLVEIAKNKRYIFLVEKLSQNKSLTSQELKELEFFEKARRKKKEDVSPDGTVDMETIALYLEKSIRMVWRYIRQGMPVIRDDKGEVSRFKVYEVFKWYYGGKGTDEDRGENYWKNEYRKNRAKIAGLDLKQKEGELIAFVDHVAIVKNQIRGIKSGFLRLPKYIAPKLSQQDPKVICEILDEEIRSIINQFAKRK